MHSILLVDDNEQLINTLKFRLEGLLIDEAIEVKTWIPTSDVDNPKEYFHSIIDENTILVITDYDLTTQGQTGLFGSSVVDWCQSRGIPVGDFSRGNPGNLPKEPNLFELRIPTQGDLAGPYIANIATGFRDIRKAIEENSADLIKKRSPPAVLAAILGVANMESQFSLYGMRLGATNAALVEKIVRTAPSDIEPSEKEKRDILSYIVSHLLLNAVLKYSGPILSQRALTAYLGVDKSEFETIDRLFLASAYKGPFSGIEKFYWLDKVDAILDEYASNMQDELKAETQGELNRLILVHKEQRNFVLHSCNRCGGINGGFLCTFTDRTVCQKADCSVGSNSWIPQGARLCRIERDFYEEWAPILGI